MGIQLSHQRRYVPVALILICSACATNSQVGNSEVVSPPSDRRGYSADPEDFFGVYFKSAQPARADALLPALSETLGGGVVALEHDLNLISTFPNDTQFAVVGFTDSEECAGEECVELSLRRAKSVRDWLVSHGVPAKRLKLPHGYGSARPIGDNKTESGRAMNRRAYISDENIP